MLFAPAAAAAELCKNDMDMSNIFWIYEGAVCIPKKCMSCEFILVLVSILHQEQTIIEHIFFIQHIFFSSGDSFVVVGGGGCGAAVQKYG